MQQILFFFLLKYKGQQLGPWRCQAILPPLQRPQCSWHTGLNLKNYTLGKLEK